MIENEWASIRDFATLFQYFWHRDFPMDRKSTGARRSDWTIHIGIVVRNIADMMGYIARFESGKRKDAVLRDIEQDIIALEWEWEDRLGNEIKKLKTHKLWTIDKDKQRKLKYSVLITYTKNLDDCCKNVLSKWNEEDKASCPLLLILIEETRSRKYFSGREFKKLRMVVFTDGRYEEIRTSPAISWNITNTRWSRK